MLHTPKKLFLIFSTLLLITLAASCSPVPGGTGRFEKTLEVTGPVRLELENGSGEVVIRAGAAGQVRVEANYEVRAWFWQDERDVAREIRESPPVSQSGNVVRVGPGRPGWNARIEYVVTVPAETEVRASVGSSTLEVEGVRGPARLRSGSGRILATAIGDDVDAGTGSGRIELRDVRGSVRAETGSGSMVLDDVKLDIRVETGSGHVRVIRPGSSVRVDTGSGSVEVEGARNDVRVDVSSGSISVAGNPAPRALWELTSRSGGVHLDVPDDAGFTFTAESRSGRIAFDIPASVTEQTKRMKRGRVGNGDARVRVETSSGSITFR